MIQPHKLLLLVLSVAACSTTSALPPEQVEPATRCGPKNAAGCESVCLGNQDPQACLAAGDARHLGNGLPRNHATAIEHYRKACSAIGGRACTELGTLLVWSSHDRDAEADQLLGERCDVGDLRACAERRHLQWFLRDRDDAGVEFEPQRGHTKSPFRARYSPDGRWLASWDGQRIVVWDTSTKLAVAHHERPASFVEFRDDTLAVLHVKGNAATLSTVGFVDGKELYEKQFILNGRATANTLSRDWRWLAVATCPRDRTDRIELNRRRCEPGRLLLFDLDNETQIARKTFPRDPVSYLRFSADESLLEFGTSTSHHRIDMSAEDKQPVQTEAPLQGRLAASPDRRFVAQLHDGHLAVHGASTPNVLWKRPDPDANSVRWSRDGRSILTTHRIWASDSGELLHFDPEARVLDVTPHGDSVAWASGNEIALTTLHGRELGKLGGRATTATHVVWRPGTRQFAMADEQGRITLWDADLLAPIRTYGPLPHRVSELRFAADGQRVLAFLPGSSTTTPPTKSSVVVWDVPSGRVQTTIAVKSAPSAYRFLENAVVFALGGVISVADLASGEITKRGDVGNGYVLDIAPDASKFLVKSADGLEIRRLDGKRIARYPNKYAGQINAAWFDRQNVVTARSSRFELWKPKGRGKVESLTPFTEVLGGPVVFTRDNRHVGFRANRYDLHVWNLERRQHVMTIPADNEWFAAGDNPDELAILGKGTIRRLNLPATGKPKLGPKRKRDDKPTGSKPPSTGRYTATLSAGPRLQVRETEHEHRIVLDFHWERQAHSSLSFQPRARLGLGGTYSGDLRLFDMAKPSFVGSFGGHQQRTTSVTASDDGEVLVTSSWDGIVRIWRRDTGEAVNLLTGGGEWLAYDRAGKFASSVGGARLAAARIGKRGYLVDQLALFNNLPHELMRRTNLGSKAARAYFERRAQRRRAQLVGRDSPNDANDLSLRLPQTTILSTEVDDERARIEFGLRSRRANLSGWRTYVNGVLVATESLEVAGARARGEVEIALSPGTNTIEVSALTREGLESVRAVTTINATHPEKERVLYFVGFGVSDYADSSLNLRYAHQDVLDLADRLSRLPGFTRVEPHIFINGDATSARLRKTGNLLDKSRPADTIVLFVAGHGLHDESGTYRYLTHDTRLTDLVNTTVPFSTFETILANAPARARLMLLDTCESGELDPDAEATLSAAATEKLAPRSLRGVKLAMTSPKARLTTAPASAARPWLRYRDRLIFADLSRRTGAVVFSSSRGGEYSYEAERIANGFFSEALLKGLDGAADEDGDGVVTLAELRRFVSANVSKETGGMQNPTVDRDNIHLRIDFPLSR